MINRVMQLQWSSLLKEEDECHLVSNENEHESESDDDSRQKGGRSVGSSIASKYETELRRVKVHNNISIKYALKNSSLPCVKRLPSGRLEEIIGDVTSKHGLDSSDICHSIIRRRETRSNNVIVTRMQCGHISSMVKVEDKVVGLIIQMACIRDPLTPSSCLQLATGFNSGTQVGKSVINFREKYCFMNDKECKNLLGRGYWNRFKQRMIIASLVSVVKNMKWVVINGRRIVIFHTYMTMSLKKYVKLALLRSSILLCG